MHAITPSPSGSKLPLKKLTKISVPLNICWVLWAVTSSAGFRLEIKLSGRLNNPLVFIGVVGEAGHPGFEEITGTLYVSTDAETALIQEIWQVTLARSPLVNTLRRCVVLSLDLNVVL
jgi:hypothetical protein